MTIQDANITKEYANKHSDSKKLTRFEKNLLTQTGPPSPVLGKINRFGRKKTETSFTGDKGMRGSELGKKYKSDPKNIVDVEKVKAAIEKAKEKENK
tara:strand:- start:614 stop:904 length:291 start_codon:yes stop_codon:yes gene_type:complete